MECPRGRVDPISVALGESLCQGDLIKSGRDQHVGATTCRFGPGKPARVQRGWRKTRGGLVQRLARGVSARHPDFQRPRLHARTANTITASQRPPARAIMPATTAVASAGPIQDT